MLAGAVAAAPEVTAELNTSCFHCGLPVPALAESYRLQLAGEWRSFCCPACRAVASTIVDSGLGDFYRYQTMSLQAAEIADANNNSEHFSVFDDPQFQRQFVRYEDDAGEQLARCDLLITGMHCAACVWLLEHYLGQLPGVTAIAVNLNEQRATISWQHSDIQLSKICEAIAALGYECGVYSRSELAAASRREQHLALRRLAVAGIGMMQVGMLAIALHAGALQGMLEPYKALIRWVSLLLATPVVFYSARPFFSAAWRGLRHRAVGMDLPVALAIGLAYSASVWATLSASGDVYFDSVTMFTFLLLVGRYLDMRARHYSNSMGIDMDSLLPATVLRIAAAGDKAISTAENLQALPLCKVVPGDQLLVKAGQIVPVDGVVVSGRSSVNEAQLSGEFMPQLKQAGDKLIAGTVNGSGALTVTVEAVGRETQLQAIADLSQQALVNKPRMAQLADSVARYFVGVVLALAAASYGYWQFIAAPEYSGQAFWIMLSVLVVSCPCALSLATPAAIGAATRRLRSLGVLVTAADVWEKIPVITDVVCDKTGTLTKGEFSLVSVQPVGNKSRSQCLQLAAALEQYSEHPIAAAFAAVAVDGVQVEDLSIAVGRGIEALIDGQSYRLGRADYASERYSVAAPVLPGEGQWLLLADSAGPLCWYELMDCVRSDASMLVQAMQARACRVHLLSGDPSTAVQQLSESLGLDHFRCAASAEDKVHYIQQIQARGGRVLMLGDGINDIPVLAAADISVAMANASELAKNHADCILLSPRLTSVMTLFDFSHRTRRVIRENLSWAIAYNLLAIPLAAAGWVPPYVAVLGMSFSSLLVVFNALRLQRFAVRQQSASSASMNPLVSTPMPGVSNG